MVLKTRNEKHWSILNMNVKGSISQSINQSINQIFFHSCLQLHSAALRIVANTHCFSLVYKFTFWLHFTIPPEYSLCTVKWAGVFYQPCNQVFKYVLDPAEINYWVKITTLTDWEEMQWSLFLLFVVGKWISVNHTPPTYWRHRPIILLQDKNKMSTEIPLNKQTIKKQ